MNITMTINLLQLEKHFQKLMGVNAGDDTAVTYSQGVALLTKACCYNTPTYLTSVADATS
ncbi:hypothetical protein E2C01_081233 [Portunus trituberculatus]|uniref:Uncharacterized protein n=1 Tax=Portunus trituberculatus TaxID=210409 RepID=A0A5B7IY51_PORTR|nr:hypothetical protein [Portunus trituberculatus]